VSRTTIATATGTRWVLLDLTIAGRVFRYTTYPGALEVSDADGRAWLYEGGLDATIPARVSGEMQPIGITIPPSGDQWASLASLGIEYDRARGIVRSCYVTRDGTAECLDSCTIAVDGYFTGITYGDSFTPLTGTIEPDDLGTGVAPEIDAVIGPSTFDTSAVSDKAIGKTYPIIIGTPGQTGEGTDPATTPAYKVGALRLLIAGHPVLASTVDIIDDEGNEVTSLAVGTASDLLGRTYSYVDTLVSPWSDDRTYSVVWDDGGGLADPQASASLLRGAGSVIQWMLTTYAPRFRLDVSRQTSVRAKLDRYLLDFAIISSVDPVAFVRKTIASVIRVDEHRTTHGTAWLPRRLTATSADVSGHLNADDGGNLDLDPTITVDSGAIANVIRLQYGVTGRSGNKALTIIADRDNTSDVDPSNIDARKVGSYACRLSQDRYGRRVSAVSTSIVMDDATASLVLADLVAQRAWPRRIVSGTGDITLDRYEPGDVVTLTHTGLKLSSVLCIIRSIEPQVDTVGITLEIVDDPARRLRATA